MLHDLRRTGKKLFGFQREGVLPVTVFLSSMYKPEFSAVLNLVDGIVHIEIQPSINKRSLCSHLVCIQTIRSVTTFSAVDIPMYNPVLAAVCLFSTNRNTSRYLPP
jgi:hypothetical protein